MVKRLSSEEVLALYKTEKNARKRIRLLAISHFLDNPNRSEIARRLKVSRRSVNNWVSNYLKFGLEGLEAKKPKGREPYLSQKQQQQLRDYINRSSQSSEGGRLTGEAIHTYISQQFGVSYHSNAIYKLLKSLGFSWITSRSRHPKQSEEIQEEFKKTNIGSDQKSTRSPTS